MDAAARAKLYGFFSRLFVKEVDDAFAAVLQGPLGPALLPDFFTTERGGIFVIAASNEPWDVGAINASIQERTATEFAITAADVDRFIDDARILTDEFAPVDQLISRP